MGSSQQETIHIPTCGHYKVRPYVPDPPQCFLCHRWGHTKKVPSVQMLQLNETWPQGSHSLHLLPEASNTKMHQLPTINFPAYRGCPLRIQGVHSIQERMGIEPRTQTLPKQPLSTPWKNNLPPPVGSTTTGVETSFSLQSVQRPLQPGSRPLLPVMKPPQPVTISWMNPKTFQILNPATMMEDFPTLPNVYTTQTQLKSQALTAPEAETMQPSTIKATLTAVLVHMQSLWKTYTIIEKLVKSLPMDIYQESKDEADLLSHMDTPDGMLQSVLHTSHTETTCSSTKGTHHLQ